MSFMRAIFKYFSLPRGEFVLWMFAFCFIVSTAKVAYQSLDPSLSPRKDLAQDYLAGRAIVERLDPYLPLPMLKERYLSWAKTSIFDHPVPHTPFFLLFTLPLSFLSYEAAVVTWLVLELLFVAVAGCLLIKEAGIPRWSHRILVLCAVVTCRPVQASFILGQSSTLLLLLCAVLAITIRRNWSIAGGISLALLIATKVFALPLLAYFVWRRRWNIVMPSLVTLVFCFGVAAIVFGPDAFAKYFGVVAPDAFGSYRSDIHNLSLWTIPQRLFGGLHPSYGLTPFAPPIILEWKLGVWMLPPLLAAFLLVACVACCVPLPDELRAVAVLCAFSVIFSPLAWVHNCAVLVVPLFVAWQAVERTRQSEFATFTLLVISILSFLGDYVGPRLVSGTTITRFESLLSLVPLFVVLALIIFLLRLPSLPIADRREGSCDTITE